MLSAALAWRRNFVARQQLGTQITPSQSIMEQLEKNISQSAIQDDFSKSAPKIIYASRTHSQLAQVIKELKNTGYQ